MGAAIDKVLRLARHYDEAKHPRGEGGKWTRADVTRGQSRARALNPSGKQFDVDKLTVGTVVRYKVGKDLVEGKILKTTSAGVSVKETVSGKVHVMPRSKIMGYREPT